MIIENIINNKVLLFKMLNQTNKKKLTLKFLNFCSTYI